MIVCVCNNVSDKNIRHAVASGATSMSELRADLDIGTCCGKCVSCARSVLRECMEKTHALDQRHREEKTPAIHIHAVHFQAQAVSA